MSRKALEDMKYETIKAHMLDPDHSLLPADLSKSSRQDCFVIEDSG